jgi:hypothetical protein
MGGRTPPNTPQEADIPENIEVVNQGTPGEQAQATEADQEEQIPTEAQ